MRVLHAADSPTFVIRNPRAIMRTRTDCDGKEAHLNSVRLTLWIRATRRNDLGNSGLCGPITSESPIRELVCCIQGLIFSRHHRRIRGLTEAEQVDLLLA
jgi:hypothetical protein